MPFVANLSHNQAKVIRRYGMVLEDEDDELTTKAQKLGIKYLKPRHKDIDVLIRSRTERMKNRKS